MNDFQKILLGAGLAIIGGIIGKFIAVFVDEWRERKFIKQSIADELSEIGTIIEKFKETYESTNQLVPKYLEQLTANTESYTAARGRLFLIIINSRRSSIKSFYRELQRAIDDNNGKLGSLGSPAGKTQEMNDVMKRFTDLKDTAKEIHKSLTSFF
jgi:hypothetical protein